MDVDGVVDGGWDVTGRVVGDVDGETTKRMIMLVLNSLLG